MSLLCGWDWNAVVAGVLHTEVVVSISELWRRHTQSCRCPIRIWRASRRCVENRDGAVLSQIVGHGSEAFCDSGEGFKRMKGGANMPVFAASLDEAQQAEKGESHLFTRSARTNAGSANGVAKPHTI